MIFGSLNRHFKPNLWNFQIAPTPQQLLRPVNGIDHTPSPVSADGSAVATDIATHDRFPLGFLCPANCASSSHVATRWTSPWTTASFGNSHRKLFNCVRSKPSFFDV